MAVDPVCGMEVDEKTCKYKSEYKKEHVTCTRKSKYIDDLVQERGKDWARCTNGC